MDVAVRPRMEPTDTERDRGFAGGFGFDTGVQASPETREAVWKDAWAQLVDSGKTICGQVTNWDAEQPHSPDDPTRKITETDLLALNEDARALARSTQTLLAIAREEKGR